MSDIKNNPGGEIPDEMDVEFKKLVREDYASFLKEINESPDSGGEAQVGEGSFQNQFEGFENRLPAPDYRLISTAIPDEDYIFLCEKILDREDLYISLQRQHFMDLAAALKIVDEDRFSEHAQGSIVSAERFYKLLEILKTSEGPQNFGQLIRDARQLKILYPGDSRKILSAINNDRWGKILETLKKLKDNKNWVNFVELYSLTFELDPKKLASELQIENSLLDSLHKFYKSTGSSLSLAQKVNFSSDMDALAFGSEQRYNFCILEDEWNNHLKSIIQSIKTGTLAEIQRFKEGGMKGGVFTFNFGKVFEPLYNAARCKYALVTAPKKSAKR